MVKRLQAARQRMVALHENGTLRRHHNFVNGVG
jgi:hypothetical protein